MCDNSVCVGLAESLVYTLVCLLRQGFVFISKQSDHVGVEIRYHVLIWFG